jgi:hypothetical protein
MSGAAHDYDRVVAAIRRAEAEGCPVASGADEMAGIALRRVASIGRRRSGMPARAVRVEDLAKGLRDHYERDPGGIGRLMTDYRWLATQIIDALS